MKVDEFRKTLKLINVDLALFFNRNSMSQDPNLFYFTNYSGVGCLVISKKTNPILLTPKMECERAKKSIKNTNQKIKILQLDKKKFLESVFEILKRKKIKVKTIGIDKNAISINQFTQLKKYFKKKKFVDISEQLSKLRIIKTQNEINILKKSCDFANKILQKGINNFSKFRTESEVAAFLEVETKKQGLEPSFSPIVGSGINSSIPHYEPQNTKLKKGFCVIDFGAKYKGYCSDMTRTIYLGKPSIKEIETYNMLLDVQISTINKIKNNIICSELYNHTIKKLGNYKKYFTHGLGHGVGVDIHELPNLTLNSLDKIQNNTVFTIEPGIYLPKKFGIRIEDTLLFSKKTTILTKLTKELIQI